MKKLASLALSAVLTVTSLGAFAQGPGAPADENRDQQGPSQGKSNKANKQQDRGQDKSNKPQVKSNKPQQVKSDKQQDRGGDQGRGADGRQEARHNEHGDFRKGQALDRKYRQQQYVVDDWRGHKLSRPPRGYHWVQVDDRYVLVAVATGIIASIILSH